MLRPGDVARPAPARTFTTELAWAGSPQTPTSVMTGWFIVIYHRRTFTGWTGSLMGCKRMTRIRKREVIRVIRGTLLGLPGIGRRRPLAKPVEHQAKALGKGVPRLPVQLGSDLPIITDPHICIPLAIGHAAPDRLGTNVHRLPCNSHHLAQGGLHARCRRCR